MKVCIYGAGAIGSHIAAKLLRAEKAEISVVARGPHLEALRTRGLIFRGDDETFRVDVPRATDAPSTLPPQDVVLVTLKAPALPANAGALARLLAPAGFVVFFLNGIPWWWNHGHTGKSGPLPLLDPDGTLWCEVEPGRAIGSVVYSPNELVQPGVVAHHSRSHFILGEPDGSLSERVKVVADLLTSSGLPAEISADIRHEIWRKLLINAAGNPLAALTRLSAHDRAEDPDLLALSRAIESEVVLTARAMGYDVKEIVPLAGKLSQGRPSMLQDVLNGRPLEIEALLGQVRDFAQQARVATPTINTLLPLLRGLDRSLRFASA